MTQDTRSATIIDFIYGLILLIFKEWSNMPMSTTWVFLGLLAGREVALTIQVGRLGLGRLQAHRSGCGQGLCRIGGQRSIGLGRHPVGQMPTGPILLR